MRLNAPPLRARRTIFLVLVTAIAVLALPAATALAGPIAPPDSSGSPNAEGIRQLYLIILGLALVVFFGVGGLILYTAFKFRARKGAVAAQIHGNNRLEVGWTVGAALLLVVISVVTFLKLDQIETPPNSPAAGLPVTKNGSFVADGAKERLPSNGKSLTIYVNGQQYLWRYTYEDGDGNNLNNVFSYEEMVAPVNTTVTLKIRSQDVQHAWWIPALGGKFDAVPGYTNFTWFQATKAGVYTGQCAELCGRNHANMTARVRIVPVQQFERWYAIQKARIKIADAAAAAKRQAADKAAKAKAVAPVVKKKAAASPAPQTAAIDAKALFVNGNPSTGALACGACHVLSAAGTSGATGPNLDTSLAKDDGVPQITEMIVKPNAEVVKGYQPNVMPQTYGKSLTPQQVAALAAYINKNSAHGG